MLDKTDHLNAHSPNAFCDNAGPEEMRHFQKLLDALDDAEIPVLVDAVGIEFQRPTKEIDRDTLEGVLDEANREDFYREYHRILGSRSN